MVPVLEAVPNFSAGRDRALVDRLVHAVSATSAEVLDASADPDHNRAVLTFVGSPDVVEEAAVAVARVAVEAVDLRDHSGVHPRIGALDVLPFVPLVGMTMEDARASARRVGARLAHEVGVPVYFYAQASDPRGRALAELRAGGFESLVDGFPPGRDPDVLPEDWSHPGIHPTAGAVCVGARSVLLAWNIEIEGLQEEEVRELATALRERDGGIPGLRALAFSLASRGRLQLSMNLEDVRNRRPFRVFRSVEEQVESAGGRVARTEVVGMLPEELIFEAGADRISLLDPHPSRVLSSRVTAHIMRRAGTLAEELLKSASSAGEGTPEEVREGLERLRSDLMDSSFGNDS